MATLSAFISPHGYGHATRAVAVLESLQNCVPKLRARIFTTLPEALFRQSLNHFTYHPALVDVGLVQGSALKADLPATLERLKAFFDCSEQLADQLAALCEDTVLTLCDISPMGILVAERLGCPSVLVENFTWDWIYAPYLQDYPEFERYQELLHNLFSRASHRVQTEPVCSQVPNSQLCGPIFRRARLDELAQLRKQLGVGERQLVVITMGGVDQPLPLWPQMVEMKEILWVLTGQPNNCQPADNVLHLGRDSQVYHPNLLCLAELVVCKAGYSSIAECCQAGTRVITVGRDDFAETKPLIDYARQHLGAQTLTPAELLSGNWLDQLPRLLQKPRPRAAEENGAAKVAALITSLL